MGNPCPLHGNFVIHHNILSVVQLIEFPVLLAKHLCGQGLSLGSHLADVQFKFREHGLTVQGPLELIQEVVNQIGPLLLIGGLAQEVLHQQRLVAGGGHLGNKNHIIRIHRILVLIG